MRQRGNVLRPEAVGVGGVVLVMLLSACASSGAAGSVDRLGTGAPTVAGVNPITPSGGSVNAGIAPTTGPEGSAARLVLKTYQDWWQAQTQAFGDKDSDGIGLETYSSGKALSDTLVGLRQLHDAKLVMTGAPRNSAVVTAVDLKADPRTAVIEDCLDVSDWHRVDAATKAAREPVGRVNRYVATASLRWFQARWLIYDFKREADRTC
ncbi:hypothetical protein [Kitasatospora aureofaciens]|uniref:hypothetical protein n=1 Tax=Kitasatospora aureofaciens TaxID=1894 RepID=UPI001C44F6BE|nr:hypothetical protein [Kitasatospora aureofaciens]MBV6697895.1 hypothetical protein [Kitasatospora aureofaciens]